MVNDEAQRLWLLQHTAAQWHLDALDPEGIAMQSILPQFFGDADQPDAIAAVRAWTAFLFDSLDEQDALVDSGARRLSSIICTRPYVADELNRRSPDAE